MAKVKIQESAQSVSSDMRELLSILDVWYAYGCQHIWRYIFAGKYVSGKKFLDVACGHGYGTDYLARRGAEFALGIDLMNNPLRIAQQMYANSDLSLAQGNALGLPLQAASLDIMISFETIEHFYEKDQFLAEVARTLKPGGKFICSTLNTRYSTGHVEHKGELNPDQFFGLLEKHFLHVERYGQYFTQKDHDDNLSQTLSWDYKKKKVSSMVLGFLAREFRPIVRRWSGWHKVKPALLALFGINDHGSINYDKWIGISETVINELDNFYAVRPFEAERPNFLLADMVGVCTV